LGVNNRKKHIDTANNRPASSDQKSGEGMVVDVSYDAKGKTEPEKEHLPPTSPQKSLRWHVSNTLRVNLYRLAKLWMKLVAGLTSLILTSIMSVVLGFGSWAPPSFVDFVKLHTSISLLIGSIVVFISLLALFFSRGPAPEYDQPSANEETRRYRRVVWYATGISSSSLLLSFVLVGMVILRPVWCPVLLCPAPQLIINPQGVHDSNLEVYSQAVQSPSYFFAGSSEQYTLNNLPMDASALRIDTPLQKPYRVVLGVHSLQQGRFGLIIEQVVLVVKQVTLVPSPMHVWIQSETRDYHSNLYQVRYEGQDAGAQLLAIYTPSNGLIDGRVQLIPGESDELDIQVTSRVVADLHFQVQVNYRVINESKEQTILLPKIFEIIFSNASNWHPYYIHNGHLILGE
jgi:hypothetical protein